MENEATQEGASLHEKIMAKLEPQPSESEEVIQEEPSTEVEAEAETDEVEIQEESDESPEMEAQDEEVSQDASEEGEPLALSDLAEYLGVEESRLDTDDDGNVLVKTKIDGEEGTVKFNDLIKSHQLEGHLNKQNMEVVEQKKQLEQKQTELESQYQTRLQETESIAQLAWTELTKEYEAVDWNDLRQNDPAEYSALKADFEARQRSISEAYQQIQAERQQKTEETQRKLQEHLQAEDQKLHEAMKWDNPEKAKKEFTEIMSYLQDTYGLTNEQLYGVRDQNGYLVQPGISDHKTILMAHKAMLYDQLQGSKPTITKKVRKAPKVAKAGAVKPVDLNAKKRQELKKQIIKSGGKSGSVAAYLLETGKV